MKNLPASLLILLAIILLLRLLSMLFLPLTDTTEARYAEVARIMMESGDWITPYFDYNIPFWGKPPLSFWMQALSFKIFGLNDFAPRFPSWVATLLTTGLIYYLLRSLNPGSLNPGSLNHGSLSHRSAALWAALIYSSFALVYLLSGVVITDPFLTLGMTLSLVSFILLLKGRNSYWGYLFFVGLSIGLLSKGPVAMVLTVGSILLWLLFSRTRWRALKLLPWVGGLLLMAVLTLPWYIAAEMKTPGFLEYFILGEHLYRFIVTDWQGDLYGNAHDKPKGTIWLLWFQASLLWGPLAILALLKHLFKQPSRSALRQIFAQQDISLYVIWALFPMIFFTLSGNILWTYILPGLPPLAILLALYLTRAQHDLTVKYFRLLVLGALVVPLSLSGYTLYAYQNNKILRTEKYLIEFYDSVAAKGQPLIYIEKRPFSARYYSKGKVLYLSMAEFKQQIRQKRNQVHSGVQNPAMQQDQEKQTSSYYIAVPERNIKSVKKAVGLPLESLYQNHRYDLFKIDGQLL